MLDRPGLVVDRCRDLYVDVFRARLSVVSCKGVGLAVVVDEAWVWEVGGDMWSSDAAERIVEGLLLGSNECEESERGDSNICHFESGRALTMLLEQYAFNAI